MVKSAFLILALMIFLTSCNRSNSNGFIGTFCGEGTIVTSAYFYDTLVITQASNSSSMVNILFKSPNAGGNGSASANVIGDSIYIPSQIINLNMPIDTTPINGWGKLNGNTLNATWIISNTSHTEVLTVRYIGTKQ